MVCRLRRRWGRCWSGIWRGIDLGQGVGFGDELRLIFHGGTGEGGGRIKLKFAVGGEIFHGRAAEVGEGRRARVDEAGSWERGWCARGLV